MGGREKLKDTVRHQDCGLISSQEVFWVFSHSGECVPAYKPPTAASQRRTLGRVVYVCVFVIFVRRSRSVSISRCDGWQQAENETAFRRSIRL